MTEEQQDAVYAAYLGICVLRSMCKKVRLGLAVQRCTELLGQLGDAFPFIVERRAQHGRTQPPAN